MMSEEIDCGHDIPERQWKGLGGTHVVFCEPCQAVRLIRTEESTPVTTTLTDSEKAADYDDLAAYAEKMTLEKAAWETEISTALDLWHTELHGGGAITPASREKCVERIKELLAERDAGWQAAYERGKTEVGTLLGTRPAIGTDLDTEWEILQGIKDPVKRNARAVNLYKAADKADREDLMRKVAVEVLGFSPESPLPRTTR